MKAHIGQALDKLAALPSRKRFQDESVLCLRLHPDMIAKSYDPQGIFGRIRDLENVGSRNYRIPTADVARTKRVKKQLEQHIREVTGRLVFVRSNDAGFRRLLRSLDEAERALPSAFREEIQCIERFDLLGANEQLLGFNPDWKEGRVEVVLHPSLHSEEEQRHFLRELFREQDAKWDRPNVAAYGDGPLFVSCHLNRSALQALAGANPLRTAHPLVFGGFENFRSAPTFPAPPASTTRTRSTIKVGMFDGGIDPNHSLLRGHVEQDNALSIKTQAIPEGIAHGTAVAGALLYGPLNDYDTAVPLPSPTVSVVSIRALPTSNPTDIDLYESIDVIETAVPSRKDIKVYNVSFGPRGPILDDMISRFTFSLDLLAVTHKVAFCVAVGNDGAAGQGMNRIQAPADLVNGLGVGAYTKRKNLNVRAPYSCQGPGRECAKLKPDVAAFGGCDQLPIHLLDVTPGTKLLSAGTSFAAPIVAALGAEAAESMDRGNALLARALLVHGAEHPDDEPDQFLGHGIVPSTLDDLILCNEKTVTIVFQGDILPTKMVKLPIMLPPNLLTSGKVGIKWTVATLSPVAPNHPSDYTAMCIEDTFYPNSQVFTFTPKRDVLGGKPRRLHIKEEANQIRTLIADGWKKSVLPVSESANQYPSESERRAQYKWEAIVRRSKLKFATSIHEPFLVLHAIPRHGATSRLEYAAVVTISAKKFDGDLYDAVRRRFTALQPVRLRTEAELRVQI
ncbi:MAG: S8 family peptidase [Chthoniobacteraceae bacterium]